MVFARLEGRAVKDGIGVMKQDLLMDPPQGCSKRNMAMPSPGHTGVKEGEPTTLAIEDQRARVSAAREIARGQVVVVNDDFPGFETDVSADISLQACVASKPETGLAATLANDVPLFVDIVGISEMLMRERLANFQQAISGELEAFAAGNVCPELLAEFLRILFISWKIFG